MRQRFIIYIKHVGGNYHILSPLFVHPKMHSCSRRVLARLELIPSCNIFTGRRNWRPRVKTLFGSALMRTYTHTHAQFARNTPAIYVQSRSSTAENKPHTKASSFTVPQNEYLLSISLSLTHCLLHTHASTLVRNYKSFPPQKSSHNLASTHTHTRGGSDCAQLVPLSLEFHIAATLFNNFVCLCS